MNTETHFWEIEDFTKNSFSLMQQGERINKTKITKTDVEKAVKQKLKVCPAHGNPHFIIGPRVEENGRILIDGRTRLRGRTKYYVLA